MDRWGVLSHVLILAIFLSAPISAFDLHYEFKEGDTGWSTGKRHGINATLELSGYSLGVGTYSRYTEMDVNDVRMRERIAAAEGTMDTSEDIFMKAIVPTSISVRSCKKYCNESGYCWTGDCEVVDSWDPVNSILVKYPGSQDYYWTINETLPVSMRANRKMDYVGRGISDRDFFGNNLDYAGSSYLYNTDLRKDRNCTLNLGNLSDLTQTPVRFFLHMNDTTDEILEDLFFRNSSLDYVIDSSSTGLASLEYRQTRDRQVVSEGMEDYSGSFRVHRRVTMNSWWWAPENQTSWLGCCPANWSGPFPGCNSSTLCVLGGGPS